MGLPGLDVAAVAAAAELGCSALETIGMQQLVEAFEGFCDLCGGELAEVKRIGSWRGRDSSGGFWFSSRCPTCDVDYRLSMPDHRSVGWHPDAPDIKELQSEIEPGELAALSAKLSRYDILRTKWEMFLNRRRAKDQVWRFASADGLHRGFTVVRNGRPVSQFVVLGIV